MNNDELITFEDRTYVNPEVSMAEQDAFMEKFRDIQGQNQAQINRDTYNLGTQVPSNQGGLVGAEGMWNVQYQRPAVNAAIENLREVNMQQALNTAMSNQQNVMSNRLDQAKRAYYRAQQEAAKRDRDNANKSGGGASDGLGINTNPNATNPEDLAVRENEQARKEYDATNQAQYNEVIENVANELQTGSYNTAGTGAFSFDMDGRTYYGQIYRDRFGNITGVSTPFMEYNADKGLEWLRNLARSGALRNAGGKSIGEIELLFGT